MNEQLDRIEMQVAQLTGKVDALVTSSEKVRKYAKWTAIITIAFIVIPLLIIPLLLPAFFASQGVGTGGTGNSDVLTQLGL